MHLFNDIVRGGEVYNKENLSVEFFFFEIITREVSKITLTVIRLSEQVISRSK